MMVLCTKHKHTMHVHIEHHVLESVGKNNRGGRCFVQSCDFILMFQHFLEVHLWPKHATSSLEWEAEVGESGACDLCDSCGDLVSGTRVHRGWKVDTSR